MDKGGEGTLWQVDAFINSMDTCVGMARTVNETTYIREKKKRKERNENEVVAFAVAQALL